jgi:hypothetical protein
MRPVQFTGLGMVLLVGLMQVRDADPRGITRGIVPLYLPGVAPSEPAPTAPRVIDAGYSEILHAVSKEPKLYRFRSNPRIYVLDFPSLHQQALTLNRVASLFEKMGMPENRVIHQGELDEYFKTNHLNPDTFYFGHNYRATNLAEFFNMVNRDNIHLNPEERRFLQMLVDLRVLVQQRGVYKVPDPPLVILTITQLQKDNPATPELDFVDMSMRCTVLRHELSHGEFATNPLYRKLTRDFWRQTLTNADRAAFRAFLLSKGYNDKDDELMANETQAYLMHSPNPRAFSAERAGLTQARVDELRKKFLEHASVSWVLQELFPKGRISPRRRAELTCDY